MGVKTGISPFGKNTNGGVWKQSTENSIWVYEREKWKHSKMHN
jgi:hypothetical protein